MCLLNKKTQKLLQDLSNFSTVAYKAVDKNYTKEHFYRKRKKRNISKHPDGYEKDCTTGKEPCSLL